MERKAYLHKVQYYETDQMGVVHHSNYIRWFEEARVDFMEQMGLGYDVMEKEGYISPVVSINCEYKSMTKFGESVLVHTKLDSFNGIKFALSYEIRDVNTKELRASGESRHCFINNVGNLISLKRENKKYYDIFMNVVGKEMCSN